MKQHFSKDVKSGLYRGTSIKGIIFDLDGVLFDTEPLHRVAWIDTLKEFGFEISDDELIEWTGIPCQLLAAAMEERWESRYSKEEFLSVKEKQFFRLIEERQSVFDGLPGYLAAVSARVPLAVASSSGGVAVRKLLEMADILRYFKGMVCYEDVEHHKPDPEAYLRAASLLGLQPANCIAVDDSPSGCRSASAAGMITLGITGSFPREELGTADHFFDSTNNACSWIIEKVFNNS